VSGGTVSGTTTSGATTWATEGVGVAGPPLGDAHPSCVPDMAGAY
jgi:hypothetical protein